MSAKLTPQLERPATAPTHVQPDGSYRITYWDPAATHGTGQFEIRRHPEKIRRGGTMAGIVCEEIKDASVLLQRKGPLTPYFDYLNLTVHFQEKSKQSALAEARYPGPERFISLLDALSLPTPGFAIFPGHEYPSEDFTRMLAEEGRILIAAEQPEQFHDIIAHAATAWALMPPEVMERAQTKARHALNQGTETTRNFMDRMDFTMSSLILGKDIVTALHYEATLEPGPKTDQYVYKAWQGIGIEIQNSFALREKVPLPSSYIYDHCHAIGAAAASMMASRPAT